MIEEVPSRGLAYRFTHELVRRALYDRLTADPARRAAPARRRGAGGGRRIDRGRALADLAHHFAAAAPLGGGARGRRVQPARRAGGDRGAGLRRGAAHAAHRARAGDRGPGARAPRSSSSSARPATAPAARSMRSTAFTVRRGDRPRACATPSCCAERRSVTRRPAGGPGSPTRAPSSCSRRRRRRSATATRRCASGCSAASLGRSTSRVTTSAGRSSATQAIEMARQLGRPHRPGDGA